MSDLWNECRSILQTRMSGGDWTRWIQPLRAWAQDDVLYLWVEHGGHPARRRVVLDRPVRSHIEDTVRRVWSRPVRVVHEAPWHGRDQRLAERRLRQLRAAAERRRDREVKAHLAIAQDECMRLLEDPSSIGLRASQLTLCRVEQLVHDRANQRLAREGLGLNTASRAFWHRAVEPQEPVVNRPLVAAAGSEEDSSDRAAGMMGPEDLRAELATWAWYNED